MGKEPLFPYLFILAMDTRSSILVRAKEGGFFFYGFIVRGRDGEGMDVSHLLFVDNTLIFCDASKENLEYLSWVFMWFEVLLGLKINLEKSELIPVGEVSNLKDLVGVLGCKVSALPTSYLRLPLGAPYKFSKV